MDRVKELQRFLKKGPPGPPPRPGLKWNDQSHRWVRDPNAGRNLPGSQYIRERPGHGKPTRSKPMGPQSSGADRAAESVSSGIQEEVRGLVEGVSGKDKASSIAGLKALRDQAQDTINQEGVENPFGQEIAPDHEKDKDAFERFHDAKRDRTSLESILRRHED